MFKALIRTLAVAATLFPGLAAAQDFPANSVLGRLSVTGDTGAPYPIPFATLFAQNPLAQGQMLIGSVGNLASPVTPSGDCTVSIGGVFICTRSNGTLFGTMAAQNASSVAITGGTIAGVAVTGSSITGLPAPSASTDAATKGYVDTASQGLVILAPTGLATAAVLPNTPTYNNGTSGVGATLTAGSNSTLTVDGTVAALNAVVLVNNQASAFQNGIYTVTTAGSGSAAWVLTRATYFNAPSNMVHGSYTFISGGVANANTSWVLAVSTTTVGTTAVNFNLFSSATAATGITYTPPGAGAVATTVGIELQRMVWIKDYGAKCDNSTDDTTAIQNAWNAAASQNLDVWLGGVGPYCKYTTLTMPTPVASTYASGFGEARASMFHGPGSSQVILSSTVTGTTCTINISATYGVNSSLVGRMSGFGVVQSAMNQTGTGFCLSNITKLTFEDVLVNGFATGINANDVILLNLEKVWLALNTVGVSGQQVSNSGPNGWNIRASHFSNNQLFTIRLAQPCLVNIDGGNDFESNGTVGTSGITVFINGFCPTSGALGLNFRDNYLEGNQGAEIELNQAGASVASVHNITGNNIARTHTTYTAGVLLVNSGSGQTNVVLGGNGMADVTGSPGTFGGWADTTSPGSLNYTFNCTQVNIVIPNSGIDQHCAGARIAGGTVTSDSNGQYVGLH